jgi:RND family efflux transporter MFP subunit
MNNSPNPGFLTVNTTAKRFLILTACLSGLLGCSPKNAFVKPPPPEVTVMLPQLRSVTVFLEIPGRTDARDFVEIRARVPGYLRSVGFVDGQIVEEGQLLFLIEPEPYKAAVVAAEANLSSAKAERDIAQTNYDRRVQAYETKAVAEIDVLTAKANLDSAEAGVLFAESALTQAMIDLSYTEILAPTTGRIGRKLISEGNMVGTGQATLLSTLVVQDPIFVYFNVSERVIASKLGLLAGIDRTAESEIQDLELELADGTRYDELGQMDYIDNQADAATGTVTVRAVFPNPIGALLPGLYGKILIPQTIEDAVLVPDLAIQRDIGGSFVLVVDDVGMVEARYVELGPKVEYDRVIESGLDGDELVVVNGLQRARPGITVSATTPAPDTSEN